MNEFPRYPTRDEVPRLMRDEVTLCYYWHYYDGPLDGAALFQNKYHWFKAVLDPTDPYLDTDGLYDLFDLPPQEWEMVNRLEDQYRERFGKSHLLVGSLLPEARWPKYYTDMRQEAERTPFIPQGLLIGTFRLWNSASDDE